MRLYWTFVCLFLFAGAAAAETPLYWAIANNDAIEVWKLADGAAPEVDNGMTLAGWAVARGSGEAMNALAWKGIALDRVDDEGRNLLFGAAALGRLDLFETIEAAGARADQVDHAGRTLLHAAAVSPHPVMLKMLLARGLGAAARSELGVTPLMIACAAGRADEVTVLLAWGAVPEDVDYLGRSVRDYAALGADGATLALIDQELLPWSISQDDAGLLPSQE